MSGDLVILQCGFLFGSVVAKRAREPLNVFGRRVLVELVLTQVVVVFGLEGALVTVVPADGVGGGVLAYYVAFQRDLLLGSVGTTWAREPLRTFVCGVFRVEVFFQIGLVPRLEETLFAFIPLRVRRRVKRSLF